MGGLAPAELAPIRGRLEAFADEVFASLPRTDQRARGQCYLRGLLLDGRRKSIEPMAARLGAVHYQALHHFVAVSPWDWRPVRRRLAERLVGALAPTAWVIDDTGFPKDGPCSVGVQRQSSGTLGKTANCQLGVSVNAVTEQASCPLDWRLLVPERWDQEAMPAGAPPATCPRTSTTGPSGSWCWTCWMSWPAGTFGRRCCWPTPATGRSGSSAGGWTPEGSPRWWRSAPTPAPTPSRCAPPSRRTRAAAGVPGRATTRRRPRWPSSPWPRGSRPAWSLSGGVAARAPNAAASCACGYARPGSPHAGWHARPAGSFRCAPLLVEWPQGKATPTKYWLANLPDRTPIAELVRLARSRWRVEQDYRERKGGLGLDHFEGRGWVGWHHHVTLVSVAHGFLTLQRLRRPKPAASA